MIFWSVFAFLIFGTPVTHSLAQAESARVSPNSSYVLTPEEVIRLTLTQGNQAKEIRLQVAQNRLAEVVVQSSYDWRLNLESGFEYDRSKSWSPWMGSDAKYERLKTSISLERFLTSGTWLGFEINQLSQKANFGTTSSGSTSTLIPAEASQQSTSLFLEQSLLGANSFGQTDRAQMSAAHQTALAVEILEADDLQHVVLANLRQFWETSVAEKNFQQSIAAQSRYTELVNVIRKKTKLGFANPGELFLAQAELELRNQNVISSKNDYLLKKGLLLTALNLPPHTELAFHFPMTLPETPSILLPTSLDHLRPLRSQKLKAGAAEAALTAAKSQEGIDFRLVARATMTGAEDSSEEALRESFSLSHPKYYAGIKLSHAFGSETKSETIKNRLATLALEKNRYEKITTETQESLLQSQRRIQSTFATCVSASALAGFRKKAVQELSRSFQQGRTDFRILIEAMNNEVAAEVSLTRSLAEAQLALIEFSALKDELIP